MLRSERMHLIKRLSIALIFLIVQLSAQVLDSDIEYYDDLPAVNETSLSSPATKIKSLPTKSSLSSRIITVLSTKSARPSTVNNRKSSVTFRSQPTSTTIGTRPTAAAAPIPPAILANNLLHQFNLYRDVDILFRIRQCDPKMKLNDMCEAYTVDNHTYSVIREPTIELATLTHVYDALIDRRVVEKLSSLCSTGRWCLGNITQQNIRFTMDVLHRHGRSFCSLDQCQHRLTIHANTCPAISSRNITIPTLKIFPMLCALYKEPQSWNSYDCAKQLVHLLHIVYAFWPQLETCHRMITAGSGGCTAGCLAFDSLLHLVENQCSANASFLTRVPTLAWYRLINLKQLCRHQSVDGGSPFISSVKNFISSNMVWYRLHQRPVYAALFIIVVICIVISFSLCLYAMSKNGYESSSRRLDDDYEYTRLHDSTFELGANTEIPNANFSEDVVNESAFDARRHHRSAEHQRLL